MMLGNNPENSEYILARKKKYNLFRKAEKRSKPECCVLCGEKKTSFCNSHSVPKMILKKIAENGKVFQPSMVMGLEAVDVIKGVNNSGVFHFICNSCDNNLFQDYENISSLNQKLTDKLLAEIALKDTLLMLSKRNVEKEIYKMFDKRPNMSGIENMLEIQRLDYRDYYDGMKLYKEIRNESNEKFQIIFCEKLPYVVPIATQVMFAMQKDLEGIEINDIYDYSEDVRIQNIHMSVFPMENSTLLLLFYHKRDKLYKRFMHQFNCLSYDNKLMYINYYIFKYTENYYISPKIKELIEDNKKLRELSRESNGYPNFGYISKLKDLRYKSVKPNEIPNILEEQYALR